MLVAVSPNYLWLLGGVVIGFAALAVGLFLSPWLAQRKNRRLIEAEKLFHTRREWLEVNFLQLASATGKPRGLVWTDCDFDDDVSFAEDRRNGRIMAFAGVTIGFEAVQGGGMEEVEAVSNLRAATAVFYYQKGTWHTDGRTLFNLPPEEAIERFGLDPIHRHSKPTTQPARS